MNSLLRRAGELRKAAGSESQPGGYEFDESSGISREDQKEILLHIEKVAKSSRILAGPDIWKVRPKKHGITLPLVVNVVGIIVLVGGLFALGMIVSPRGDDSALGSSALNSAEGKVLQEIRREAEGRIQDKDKEIANIQRRMALLDSEKDQLLAGADSRLKAKEDELRIGLLKELEAERGRLQAEGLSETQVQARLSEFEKRKSTEFNTQLESFARKAEEERLALQATIDQAKEEYRKTLSLATAERQRIQDDSRIREQDLRSQLDEQNKALLIEREKSAASISGAQAELTRLNEEAARIRAVEDRLQGLYSATRQSLQDGRLDDAKRSLDSLKAYLADTQVTSMGSLRPRRELDLFAAELIERAIGTERAKASADTTNITAALDALAVVKEAVEAARISLSAGDANAAEASYKRALSATKELKESGAFLEETWKNRLDAQTARIEADRAAAERASVARAAEASEVLKETRLAMEAAAAAIDDRALSTAFKRLLSNLPIGPADASRLYSYIQSSGLKEAETTRRKTDTESANEAMTSAASDLASGRFLQAIQGYGSVLARYPAAAQSPQAVDGIGKAGSGLAEALQESRTRSAERIAGLEQSLAAAREELASVPQTTKAATGPDTSAELLALKEEKATIEADLATAKARFKAMSAAWQAYVEDEDAILAQSGPLTLIEARNRLDVFLSSQPVAAAFPGMRDRIAFYLASFQKAGQDEILYNAADIVDGAVRIRDADVRTRYFIDLEKRYAGNESMLEFLGRLKLGFSR